jgi:hypothetical protein
VEKKGEIGLQSPIKIKLGLLALAVMVPTVKAAAQGGQAQSTCPAGAAPLPAALAAWPDRVPLQAASDAAALASAQIEVGQAIDAALHPTPEIHYAQRPEKPGGSVSFGGLFALTIEQTGTYRVALGSAAWIDLTRDGKAVASTAHGRGPECSGIRKMVDFSLTPGDYVLQISANGTNTTPLLVTRLP